VKQKRITETYKKKIYGFPYHNGVISGLIPMLFEDKDGIPVIYDAATQQKQCESDEISILSHELLSPLTLIKGYAVTLLELGSVIGEEQKDRYLKGIESAANKLIYLLENFRDLIRLEGTDKFNHQPTSLTDLIQEVISDVQSHTASHFIKFNPFISLPKVNINRQKIERVIINLLYNAIKYSPEETDIEVEINQVRSQNELEELFTNAPLTRFPCLVVSISDSGIGIPEMELEKIFDRSYRLDNGITGTAGFGFGLYLCRIMVEAHGGRIWARNRAQKGSTFCFSLPLEQ
jgi:signal transduction histidine kinase